MEALSYFNYYQELSKRLKEEYEYHFGPLQYQNQNNIDNWNWIKGPWPWEGEV